MSRPTAPRLPKLCYPKQMVRVFNSCLPFFIVTSSSTMFSAAAQHASTATTFLTGGCAHTTTNAATSSSSSSSSSRRAFFSTKRQTPKRIIAGKATASNVSRNPNMGQLQAGYLFPEIARIRNAHLEKNPDAKIISLGIGDTTVRFYARRTTTKSAFFFFVGVSRFYPFDYVSRNRCDFELVFSSSGARSPPAVSSSPHNRNQSQHRSFLAWQMRRWR